MRSNKIYLVLVLMLLIYGCLYLASPQLGRVSLVAVGKTLKEMVLIMPGVFMLMGLFETWIPKEAIRKMLGSRSGLKGIGLAFLMGTLPTGPLYAAFPLASGLHDKGARLMNIVIFLNTWAALKVPQLMVEAKFLGLDFTLWRLALTVPFVIIMGFLIERFNPPIPWPVHPKASRNGGGE